VHPDPERLFEQAETLINGYKNETDLRRAISTAFYGVFHFVLRQVADAVAGFGNRSTNLYGMVYRSVEYKPLRDLCVTLGSRVRSYAPVGGFGPVVQFAKLVEQLYEQRILADYVPLHAFDVRRSQLIVNYGREAVAHFTAATPEQRSAFIALLVEASLFPPS
jgi:hypothetical protein